MADGNVSYQPTGGGGMANYGWIGDTISQRRTAQHGVDQSTINMAGGDVEALRQVLANMMGGTTAEGADALVKQIFKQGMESQFPKLLGATMQAGMRPGSSTTNSLLTNDLVARLTGEAIGAVRENQIAAGNLATQLAEQTKKPTVTTATGQGKISGADSLSLGDLFTGMFK